MIVQLRRLIVCSSSVKYGTTVQCQGQGGAGHTLAQGDIGTMHFCTALTRDNTHASDTQGENEHTFDKIRSI